MKRKPQGAILLSCGFIINIYNKYLIKRSLFNEFIANGAAGYAHAAAVAL